MADDHTIPTIVPSGRNAAWSTPVRCSHFRELEPKEDGTPVFDTAVMAPLKARHEDGLTKPSAVLLYKQMVTSVIVDALTNHFLAEASEGVSPSTLLGCDDAATAFACIKAGWRTSKPEVTTMRMLSSWANLSGSKIALKKEGVLYMKNIGFKWLTSPTQPTDDAGAPAEEQAASSKRASEGDANPTPLKQLKAVSAPRTVAPADATAKAREAAKAKAALQKKTEDDTEFKEATRILDEKAALETQAKKAKTEIGEVITSAEDLLGDHDDNLTLSRRNTAIVGLVNTGKTTVLAAYVSAMQIIDPVRLDVLGVKSGQHFSVNKIPLSFNELTTDHLLDPCLEDKRLACPFTVVATLGTAAQEQDDDGAEEHLNYNNIHVLPLACDPQAAAVQLLQKPNGMRILEDGDYTGALGGAVAYNEDFLKELHSGVGKDNAILLAKHDNAGFTPVLKRQTRYLDHDTDKFETRTTEVQLDVEQDFGIKNVIACFDRRPTRLSTTKLFGKPEDPGSLAHMMWRRLGKENYELLILRLVWEYDDTEVTVGQFGGFFFWSPRDAMAPASLEEHVFVFNAEFGKANAEVIEKLKDVDEEQRGTIFKMLRDMGGLGVVGPAEDADKPPEDAEEPAEGAAVAGI
jgi:hypothetical protein